ncbi:MAG: hypothetical protein U0412_00390 [Nitrospira sp.]
MPVSPSAMLPVNIGLGTLVVTVGFWLLWGTLAPGLLATWALCAGGLIYWKGRTVTEVWAWTTLLLGLESFAWPVVLMIQLKAVTATPPEEEMGAVLSAIILGLFSSVFWVSFSYGLFKRAWGTLTPASPPNPPVPQPSGRPANRKKR